MRDNILGKRIKELRNNKRMKQSELCQDFSKFCKRSTVLPVSTLSSWENGAKHPSLDATRMLADYFKVSTDYLLGREAVSESKAKKLFFLDEYINEISRDDLPYYNNKPVFLTYFDGKKQYGEWGIYNMDKDVFRCSEHSIRNSEVFKYFSLPKN